MDATDIRFRQGFLCVYAAYWSTAEAYKSRKMTKSRQNKHQVEDGGKKNCMCNVTEPFLLELTHERPCNTWSYRPHQWAAIQGFLPLLHWAHWEWCNYQQSRKLLIEKLMLEVSIPNEVSSNGILTLPLRQVHELSGNTLILCRCLLFTLPKEISMEDKH